MNWYLFRIKPESGHDDIFGEVYHYTSTTVNYKRVKVGDEFVYDSKSGDTLYFHGMGVVCGRDVDKKGIMTKYAERKEIYAKLGEFFSFDPPISCPLSLQKEIVSSTGYNPQNSIRRVKENIFKKIIGLSRK